MAPKKSVAVASARVTPRVSTRASARLAGGRSDGLTSSPAQLASSSTKKVKKVRSRGVDSKSKRALGIAERRGLRTTTDDWVDVETDSMGEEDDRDQHTELTRKGREGNLVPPVDRDKVADSISRSNIYTPTSCIRSRLEKAPNVRTARSILTLGAETGQCDRRGLVPAEATLGRRTRVERQEEKSLEANVSGDSYLLDGTAVQQDQSALSQPKGTTVHGGIACETDSPYLGRAHRQPNHLAERVRWPADYGWQSPTSRQPSDNQRHEMHTRLQPSGKAATHRRRSNSCTLGCHVDTSPGDYATARPSSRGERRPAPPNGCARRSISADRGVTPLPSNYRNSSRQRPVDNSITVPRFDGTGDVELFLKRFQSVAQYYGWNDKEQVFRLEHCLTDNVQYVLMDVPPANDIDEFIRTLRGRFGAVANAEQHRAELSRLRRGDRSIQELYLEVRRLVNKAFPGTWTVLTEVYARDAFLNAIGDPELRRRIMLAVPPPETLAMTYDLAVRALAYDENDTCRRDGFSRESGQGRKGQFQARVLKEDQPTSSSTTGVNHDATEMAELRRQLAELRTAFNNVQQRREPAVVAQPQPAVTIQPPPTNANASTTVTTSAGGRPPVICWKCQQAGHIARHCTGQKVTNVNAGQANVLAAGPRGKSRTYMDITHGGRTYKVLLDTGCDITILSRRLLPGLQLNQTQQKVFAANCSPVAIMGSTTFEFDISGFRMQHECLVSDEIEENIFGVDWLVTHNCTWNFGDGTLWIRSSSEPLQVKLSPGGPKSCVRRLYVQDNVELVPNTQSNVLVKSVWSTLPSRAVDWLVEPKEVHRGVIMARTLLPSDVGNACVRMINCGPTSCVLRDGELLTTAEAIGKVGSTKEPTTDREATNNSDEHVQCLLETLPDNLTEEQHQQAINFIRRYAAVFSKSATDLGRNRTIPHRINTGSHPPVRQPLRRQPYAHQAEIERNVQELLAAKAIEPAQSPWQSNVLLVPKRDKSWRFCVDYRALNNITVKDSYPLPRIDACLDSLGGAQYFSTLDLRAGYWQTELAEEDANKTAFCTRSGQYRFRVLSMGLVNAPSQFQRLMDVILSGLTFESCLVYLDDIICFSRTFEEHLERLGGIFDRLAAADLKLRATKCQLFRPQVHFLGHVISAVGIAADPEKIRVVANWPIPRNVHEVRSFLGLSGYYRKFVSGYADIAKPLHILTSKQQPFVWKAEQQESFQMLKDRLVSAPVLASPRDEGDYVLDTDASLYGLGVVLQQWQEGELRVIAYGSRCLSSAEQNYSTTRRELLAVVYGFKQFRQFLLGRHFLLRVDHSALTYLRKTPEPIGQAARWLEYIEEYDFDIIHRSGVTHGNCDALSRRPWPEQDVTTNEEANENNVRRLHRPEVVPPCEPEVTSENIAIEQQKEVGLKVLIDALKDSGPRPEWSAVQQASEESRILWAQFDSLVLKDGLLQRCYYSPDGAVQRHQIVIPVSLRQAFLKELHESENNIATAHLGVKKTLSHVSQRAYWPSWRSDTERYCRRCAICQTIQHGIAPRHGELKPYAASCVGDRLHTDLTGPHVASRQGSIYILTAIDAYSRFLFCVPLKNKTALTVARALVEHVFLPFGSFRTIVSDQGKEFCNELLTAITTLLGIRKLRTTGYRPSANGRIERVHRSLNDLLSKIVSESQRDWEDKLPMVTAAYNAARHEATGYSPYYLLYGREYCTPLDLTLKAPSPSYADTEIDYVDQLRDCLKEAYSSVNEKFKADTQRMKRRYDERVKAIQFNAGDCVLYYCPLRKVGRNQKWRRLCRIGVIVQRLNDILYRVKLGPHAAVVVAHVDRLRKFDGDPPPWKPAVMSRECPPWVASRPPQDDGKVVDLRGDTDARPAATRDAQPAVVMPTPTPTDTTSTIKTADKSAPTPPAAAEETQSTGQPSSRIGIKRERREIRRPVRFRMIKQAGEMEEADQPPKRRRYGRTPAQKQRRKERNRGPFLCTICAHELQHISGLRQHVILTHRRDCSWTGQVAEFASQEDAERAVAAARARGQHRSRRTAKSNTSVSATQPETPVMSTTILTAVQSSTPVALSLVDVAVQTEAPVTSSSVDAAVQTEAPVTSLPVAIRKLYAPISSPVSPAVAEACRDNGTSTSDTQPTINELLPAFDIDEMEPNEFNMSDLLNLSTDASELFSL